MEFYTIFHKNYTKLRILSSHLCNCYLLEPNIFKGKLVNVIVEENSKLTRGETIVDWLGVTKKTKLYGMSPDDKKFFKLLKNKLSLPKIIVFAIFLLITLS